MFNYSLVVNDEYCGSFRCSRYEIEEVNSFEGIVRGNVITYNLYFYDSNDLLIYRLIANECVTTWVHNSILYFNVER